MAAPLAGKTITVLAAPSRGTMLLGAQGSEYVANLLRSKGPHQAVQELHAQFGLQHPLCKPLLQMLDYLDISRREAHLFVLGKARKLLLDWVGSMRAAAQQCSSEQGGDGPESKEEIELQEKLERLLNASFKYMGVPELKQVPMEVMDCMSHVPAPYLKQLAEDREIFNELPAAVKQQVYESDRNLLQQDAVQYIAAYKYELGTVLAALNMCQFVRQRPRLCDKQQQQQARSGSQQHQLAGLVSGAAAGSHPAKPGAWAGGRGFGGAAAGLGGRGGGRARAASGFSVKSVLNAVLKDKGEDQEAADTKHRAPLHNPPKSPSTSADASPLALLGVRGPGGGTGGRAPAAAGALLPSRKTVRSGSEAIKQLREMVGASGKIYSHLVELCQVRLTESPSLYLGCKELSYCALRTQLLMSLHDSSQKAPGSGSKAGAAASKERHILTRVREVLPREGRSHDLVWLLDAALSQRRLSPQHMRRLGELFADYVRPPSRFLEEEEQQHRAAAAAGTPAASGPQAAGGKRATPAVAGGKRPSGGGAAAPGGSAAGGHKRRRLGSGVPAGPVRAAGPADSDDDEQLGDFIVRDELDAEDACGANASAQDRWLAEAGMVLRDPPTMHMLAAQVVDTLYRCLALGRLPADVPQLAWQLRLMALGVAARANLREASATMPPAPTRDLHTVWPELLVMLAEGEADAAPWDQHRQRSPGSTSGEGQAAATRSGSAQGWQLLVAAYDKNEVLRKVVQMCVLDRLANSDLMTAHHLLLLLLSSRQLLSPAATPEYAPFAYSLAGQLQDLVKARLLQPGSSFWRTAVDQVLLPLVDADSQVHIEVLRLLLSVCKELEAASLASSLGQMLAATEASRARNASQKKKFASITAQYMSQARAGDQGVPGYIMGGAASEWSDGFRTVRSLKYGGSSDGFSELYRKIVVVGGLQDKQHLWPQALTSFMQELAEKRAAEEADRRLEQQAAWEEAERQAAADAAETGGTAAGS